MNDKYVLVPENVYAAFVPHRKIDVVKKFEQELEREIPGVDFHTTRNSSCVGKLANDLYNSNQKENVVFLGGGDGFISEFIESLVTEEQNAAVKGRLEDLVICTLRAGSGNGRQDGLGITHSWNFRKEVMNHTDAIRNGRIVPNQLINVDFGRDSYRIGSLVGVNGFDVKVLEKRDATKYQFGLKKGIVKPGFPNYAASTLRTYFEGKKNGFEDEFFVKGSLSGEEFEKTISSAVTEIGTRDYFGNEFRVCPEATGYSGMHFNAFSDEVVSIKPHLFWNMYHGNHDAIRKILGEESIFHRKIDNITIQTQKPISIHVDGEFETVEKQSGDYTINAKLSDYKVNFAVSKPYFDRFLDWQSRAKQ